MSFYFAATGKPQIFMDFFGRPVSFPGNVDDPPLVIEYQRRGMRHVAAKVPIRAADPRHHRLHGAPRLGVVGPLTDDQRSQLARILSTGRHWFS